MFFFFGFLDATPARIIAVRITAQAVVILFCAARMKRYIFSLRLSGAMKKIAVMLEYSWPLIVLALCSFVVGWVDVIIIKKYMNIEDVGIYSLAYQGMNFVNLLIASFVALAFPFIASLEAVKRSDLVVKYIDRFLPGGGFVCRVFLCGVMFISSILIRPVFGDSYSPAAHPFLMLAVGLGFSSIGIFYAGVINAFNLLKKYVFLSVICAFFNVAADFVLVPRIGIQGAAFATMLTSMTGAFIYIAVVNGCTALEPSKSRYGVFFCCLPALSCLPFFLFSDYAVLNFVFTVAAVLLAAFVLRRGAFFAADDIKFIEQIKMPGFLRSGLMKFLFYMSEQ